MKITGLTHPSAGARGIQDGARPRTEADPSKGVANPNRTVAEPVTTGESLGISRPPPSLPVEPPPGTDPELWSVLTAEERVFFARVGAMGPLTYGRVGSQAQTPPPLTAVRGGRLNVRA